MSDDPPKILTKKEVADALAKIDAADTPENFERLKVEAVALGLRITKRGKGVSAYTLTINQRGDAIEGATLADITDMIEKLKNEKRD